MASFGRLKLPPTTPLQGLVGLKTRKMDPCRPKTAQDAPRGRQDPPRGRQDHPRCPRRPTQSPQTPSKTRQNNPKSFQDGLREFFVFVLCSSLCSSLCLLSSLFPFFFLHSSLPPLSSSRSTVRIWAHTPRWTTPSAKQPRAFRALQPRPQPRALSAPPAPLCCLLQRLVFGRCGVWEV